MIICEDHDKPWYLPGPVLLRSRSGNMNPSLRNQNTVYGTSPDWPSQKQDKMPIYWNNSACVTIRGGFGMLYVSEVIINEVCWTHSHPTELNCGSWDVKHWCFACPSAFICTRFPFSLVCVAPWAAPLNARGTTAGEYWSCCHDNENR